MAGFCKKLNESEQMAQQHYLLHNKPGICLALVVYSCKEIIVQASEAQRIMAYDAQKKSAAVAYLLWWFLGTFGAHRFYMGRTVSAIFMLLLHISSWILVLGLIGVVGLVAVAIWWFIDAILIPGYIRRYNMRLAVRLG